MVSGKEIQRKSNLSITVRGEGGGGVKPSHGSSQGIVKKAVILKPKDLYNV